MTPFLVFEEVGKAFRTGARSDSLVTLLSGLVRGGRRAPRDEFWALRDVSFSVGPGEVLGIIGSNGAGKSTTLKLLNRIMEPTRGQVRVEGRIGALIEISAGFHPDLSGRQNVFLQGSIMGMSESDIRRKFDEIVDFAGIAPFIDTPVKRYSSGMNARLGFAIAAHLEPEILIIDEVLSVGDHAFQSKAYQKIKSMASQGVPVVLVSHQLDKVVDLCTKAVLLERGAVKRTGSAAQCIAEYLLPSDADAVAASEALTLDTIEIASARPFRSGGTLEFTIGGKVRGELHPAETIAVRLLDPRSGHHLYSIAASDYGLTLRPPAFRHRLHFQLNVPSGEYLLEALHWDSARNVDLARSPRVLIDVLPARPFWGTVQLNADWQDIVTLQSEPNDE